MQPGRPRRGSRGHDDQQTAARLRHGPGTVRHPLGATLRGHRRPAAQRGDRLAASTSRTRSRAGGCPSGHRRDPRQCWRGRGGTSATSGLDERGIDPFRRRVYAATRDVQPGTTSHLRAGRTGDREPDAAGTSAPHSPATRRRSSSRAIGSSRPTAGSTGSRRPAGSRRSGGCSSSRAPPGFGQQVLSADHRAPGTPARACPRQAPRSAQPPWRPRRALPVATSPAGRSPRPSRAPITSGSASSNSMNRPAP